MRYIESPDGCLIAETDTSIFLAGGITDCPDWQAELAAMLRDTDLVLFNPRRNDFPIHDPTAAEKQITWEHDRLRQATAVSFWFPAETLCPIVLYELGAWSMTSKPIFIGIHPNYKRRQDVEIQTRLIRPDVPIVYSIADLAAALKGLDHVFVHGFWHD